MLFPETTSVAIAEKDVCTSVVTSVVTGVSIAAGATPTEAAETTSVIASIMDVVSEKDKLALDSVEKEPVPEKDKTVSGTGSSTTVTTSIATGAIAAVVTGVSIAAGATPTEAAAIGGASGVIAYKAITSGGFNYSKENWGRSILSSIITGAACGLATNSIMKVITSAGSSPATFTSSPSISAAPITTGTVAVMGNNTPSASGMLQGFILDNYNEPDTNYFLLDGKLFDFSGHSIEEIVGMYGEIVVECIKHFSQIAGAASCSAKAASEGVKAASIASGVIKLEDFSLIELIKDIVIEANLICTSSEATAKNLVNLAKLYRDEEIPDIIFSEMISDASTVDQNFFFDKISIMQEKVKRLEQGILSKASQLGIEIKPVEPEPVVFRSEFYARGRLMSHMLECANSIEASKLTIRDAVEAIKAKEKPVPQPQPESQPVPQPQPEPQPTHAFKYGLVVGIIVVFTFVGGMAKAGLLV